MVKRYPTLFKLCCPITSTLLSVCLSLAAFRLTTEVAALRFLLAGALVRKLQWLVLAKLAHLGPNLRLPANYQFRLCNSHPSHFRTVDTSYGRTLELVITYASLAVPLLPPPA